MSDKWRVIHEWNVVDDSDRLIANCGGHSKSNDNGQSHRENIENARRIASLPVLEREHLELIRALDIIFTWHALEPEEFLAKIEAEPDRNAIRKQLDDWLESQAYIEGYYDIPDIR